MKLLATGLRKLRAAMLPLAVAGGVLANASVAANWSSAGMLAVPQYNYTFLAATPAGDLLAATIYSEAATAPPTEIPALLIRNPGSPNPEVSELCRLTFAPNRGFAGIACDPSGSFFVSGDTGEAATSFIRKFSRDGMPDAKFGTNGVVLPGRRCLGVEAFGEHVLCALDWGLVGVFRSDTGEKIGELPKATQSFFLRDIAIDPKSLRVFGVAEGGILTWGNGAPWDPRRYSFRVLAPKSSEPRSGEGITIDPLRRTVLNTPIPGNVLTEIFGTGEVQRYVVSSAAPTAHLGDSALSFDGRTLFVSDVAGRSIHMMRREIADTGAGAQVQAVANATTGKVPPPKWYQSYEFTVRHAREAGQPMLVYFRKADVANCVQFESAVLKTDQFNLQAAGMACVFEDLARDTLLAYRFGVYRVPHVVVLDKNGNQVGEYRHPIAPDVLFQAMGTAKQ